MNLAHDLRSLRKNLGLRQIDLAQSAGVSLATLQAIEAGTANPEWATIEALCKALGLELTAQPRKPNWEMLQKAGVALAGEEYPGGLASLNRTEVVQEWSRAWSSQEGERERDALLAFLHAIRTHFPSWFKKDWAKNTLASEALNLPISGRIVKLRRISLNLLSRWV